MKMFVHTTTMTTALILLLVIYSRAQPGFGFVLVRMIDTKRNAVKTKNINATVLPWHFNQAKTASWVQAGRDSISDEWVRLPSRVQAFRFFRGDRIMEVWLDKFTMNLDQDLYIDSLPWAPGSFTLFTRSLQTGLAISLPGTGSTIAGQYISHPVIKSRKPLLVNH